MRLIHRVDGVHFRMADRPARFGWRWEREPGRDAYLHMPSWLYHARKLRRLHWSIMGTLVRFGFWRLKSEGGYYTDGSWTWAWWRTLNERFGRSSPRAYTFAYRGRWRFVEPSRWERFGWWLQRAIDDMRAPYA